MKKWLSLLLAACMLFSLAACSQEDVDTERGVVLEEIGMWTPPWIFWTR